MLTGSMKTAASMSNIASSTRLKGWERGGASDGIQGTGMAEEGLGMVQLGSAGG
jgi:hypothetical protein